MLTSSASLSPRSNANNNVHWIKLCAPCKRGQRKIFKINKVTATHNLLAFSPLKPSSIHQTRRRPGRTIRQHPNPSRRPIPTRLRRRTLRHNLQRRKKRLRIRRPFLRARLHRRQRRLSAELPNPRLGLRKPILLRQILRLVCADRSYCSSCRGRGSPSA